MKIVVDYIPDGSKECIKSFISWVQLKHYIGKAVRKTEQEDIVGLEVGKDGITVTFKRV